MEGVLTKRTFVDHMLKIASERWGQEEVEQMKSSIEGIAGAILMLKGLKLEPWEEPARPEVER